MKGGGWALIEEEGVLHIPSFLGKQTYPQQEGGQVWLRERDSWTLAPFLLCGLGQVTIPLWASVSFCVK